MPDTLNRLSLILATTFQEKNVYYASFTDRRLKFRGLVEFSHVIAKFELKVVLLLSDFYYHPSDTQIFF